jgi:predicted permease
MKDLIRRAWYVLRQRRLEADVAEEIRFHHAMKVRELEASGLAPRDAGFAARRKLGDVIQARENARAVWVRPSFDTFRQDLAHAVRSVVRQRSLSAAVIITLTLGVGANAALFSIVHAVLLKPLPYRDADNLVWIAEYIRPLNAEATFESVLREWRQARAFETMAVFHVSDTFLSDGRGEATPVRVVSTSEPVDRLLGVSPRLGRDFGVDDLRPGTGTHQGVALLTDQAFQRWFGNDPGVLGTRVTIQGRPVVIVGVLPADFRIPLRPSLRAGPQIEPDFVLNYVLSPAGSAPVHVLARLAPDVPLQAARAELETLTAASRMRTPSMLGNELRIMPLYDRIVGATQPALLVLWGAVAFVLLVACVNVANLLLAASTGRRAEMAARSALGAGRGRLMRQLFTESTVLAVAGGAGGVLFAYGVLWVVLQASPLDIPRLRDARVDGTVLWFSVAICLATAVIIGIVPALVTSCTRPADILKESATTKSLSHAQGRMQGALVIGQVALALVLSTGAGLMLKSLSVVRSAAEAYAPDDVVAFRVVSANPELSGAPAAHARFVGDLVRQMEAVPGVRAAGAWSHGLTSSVLSTWRAPGLTAPPMVLNSVVTPHFMEASGVRLLAGRWFDARDERSESRVVVVNEAAARLLAPAGAVGWLVGKTLAAGEVVGVVSDFRWRPDVTVEPQLFWLYAHAPNTAWTEVLVRTTVEPMALAGALRRVVVRHPRVDMTPPETLDARVTAAAGSRRFQTWVFSSFAALALLLTVVGVHGVLSYSVSQRTQEIGIRMALGAEAGVVMRMILARGVTLVLAGVATGLLGATSLTRLMSGLLFGVNATDTPTFAAACLLLIAVGLFAASLPARRAMRLNPAVALRWGHL